MAVPMVKVSRDSNSVTFGVNVMKAPFVWQTWHLVTASMSKVVLFGRGNSFAWPL